jgi:hypothetical protein
MSVISKPAPRTPSMTRRRTLAKSPRTGSPGAIKRTTASGVGLRPPARNRVDPQGEHKKRPENKLQLIWQVGS